MFGSVRCERRVMVRSRLKGRSHARVVSRFRARRKNSTEQALRQSEPGECRVLRRISRPNMRRRRPLGGVPLPPGVAILLGCAMLDSPKPRSRTRQATAREKETRHSRLADPNDRDDAFYLRDEAKIATTSLSTYYRFSDSIRKSGGFELVTRNHSESQLNSESFGVDFIPSSPN